MLEWNGTFGPAAIFSLISLLGVALLAVKGLGVREADAKALARRFDALEADVANIRKEREQFQIAVNAGISALRENVIDFQRSVAERYATKSEVVALEERTDKGMDRIVDRLEQISNRLETIGDAIIKTLADQRR